MDELGKDVAVNDGNGAERVSFWAVACRYLLRIGLFCIVFRITTDFDSLSDLFADGDWFQYVKGIDLLLGLAILLNLENDCRLRLRNGYWVRAGRSLPKSWIWESVMWVAVLLMSLLLFGKMSRETIDGVTWRYTVSKGKAIITRGRNRNQSRAAISVLTSGDLTVPSTLGGCPVEGIGHFAFYQCKRLRSVSIPDGVRWIGIEAFNGCDGLTSVVLPDGVTHIMYEAFRDCRNLASVTIPENIESIDETAFDGTPFLDKTPDGLIVFGGTAYKWKGKCPAEVVIPEDVRRIFDNAFERRTGLKSVVVANSVTNVGFAAFNGCAGLTSVTLGNSVASIENGAFYACFNLSSVSIPKSLTSVGEDAFRGCPIKTVYVEKGDAERVKELLRGKGVDVGKVEFVERGESQTEPALLIPADGQAK